MTADRVTLVSPAKVNLFLEVGERRADGYHDVVTVLQALDERASDTLDMSVAEDLSVVCMPDIGVPQEENLVTRALVRLGEVVGRAPSFAVTVHKRIPAAGGLGGASSNAAAALVGACMLWGIEPVSAVVLDVARSLGADVPFFIEGGCALYGERGDVLMSRLSTPVLPVVLINPGEPVSTAAAYAMFDRRLHAATRSATDMMTALRSGEAAVVAGALSNNLGEVAAEIAPTMSEALAYLRGADGVLGALVAGSGSTVFAVCESDAAAGRVAGEAAAHEGWWVVATGTSPFGVRSRRTDGG